MEIVRAHIAQVADTGRADIYPPRGYADDDEGDIAGIVTVDDAMEILLPKNFQRRLPRLFG